MKREGSRGVPTGLRVGVVLCLALLLVAGAHCAQPQLRVNCGGDALADGAYAADTGAWRSAGARTYASRNRALPPVLRSHAYAPDGMAHLKYTLPAPEAGAYDVTLAFAETEAKPGARLFRVSVNGKEVKGVVNGVSVENGLLDVARVAGGIGKALVVKVGEVKPVDGVIQVELERVPGKGDPMIGAIVVERTDDDEHNGEAEGQMDALAERMCVGTGAAAGKSPRAFRINCGGAAVARLAFGADNVAYIAEAAKGREGVAMGTLQGNGVYKEVYNTYRYTFGPSLTYKIPVPDGVYTVVTMHAETYFDRPGERVFDVVVNGVVKRKALDVFKAKGKNTPLYTAYRDVPSKDGYITVSFSKVRQNPFVSGLMILGDKAAELAAGGSCAPAGTPPTDAVSKGLTGGSDHQAHAVLGGPYIATDLDKNGREEVQVDGTDSHSHYDDPGPPPVVGRIVAYDWRWRDPSNPDADADGVVTNKSPEGKFTASFPIGRTRLDLEVTDNLGDKASDHTFVEVKRATQQGAYCYAYNYFSQNHNTVPLSHAVSAFPKPRYGALFPTLDFNSVQSFSKLPFSKNAFAVRCLFFINVLKAGPKSYRLVHSGPVRIYGKGKLMASSNSNAANTVTKTPTTFFKAGRHAWQVLYFRPKGKPAKLTLQFSGGTSMGPSNIQHDASDILPVITGLSYTSSAESGGGDVQIYGSGFFNGVAVTFGGKRAQNLYMLQSGDIQVTVPRGTGTVKVTVTTKAGVSNAVRFNYVKGNTLDSQPIKFTETTLKHTSGTNYAIHQIASVTYGPDGRLYMGGLNSMLYALTVNKNFAVTKTCQKSVATKVKRSVLGLAFNPKSNALKLYFSTSTTKWRPVLSDEEGWRNGKIQSVTMSGPTGCFRNDVTDVVSGLPVSAEQHAVNKIQFLPNGQMLIGIGGFTNGGIPLKGSEFEIPENPLSAAIVSCPVSGTVMKYSSPRDPEKAKIIGGSCKVYASGLRNSFGMWYHTNKKLYATDNSPNANFGALATNCNGGQEKERNIPDKLFLVQPGKCHGFPNLNRKECRFEDPKCVKPLLSTLKSSTGGVMEYRSNSFGGKMKGNLLLSKFAGIKTTGIVSRVMLTASGQVEHNGYIDNFFEASGVSIAEGPRGEIVMPRVYKDHVVVLRPAYKPPRTTFLLSVLPRQGPASGGSRVLVSGHNFGSRPNVTFDGKACKVDKVVDDNAFYCITPAGTSDKLAKVVVTGSAGTSPSYGADYWYF